MLISLKTDMIFLLYIQVVSVINISYWYAKKSFPTHKISPLFNSLPNNKTKDLSKLKVLADDKINETERLKCVLGWVENIMGKRENAGYQHFLFFP